jgi:hypothetical protein
MVRFTLFLAAMACSAQAATAQTGDRRQLANELRAEVEAFRTSLPMREGVLSITAVALRGVEIVYTGTVHADFDANQIATFRRAVVDGLCSQDTREVIRRGASFTYDLRDEGGERFVTTISRCE